MWSVVRRSKLNLVAVVFILALAKIALFSTVGLKMLTDDGQNFTATQRLGRGEVPYQDYQNFFPPFTDLFTLTALQLTNNSILVTRLVYGVVAAAAIPTIYVLSKQLSNTPPALLVSLIILWGDTRVDLLFFQTLFLASIWWLGKDKPLKAGMALGLGSLWRPELALAWWLGGTVYLLVKRKARQISKYIFIPALVGLLTALVLYQYQLLFLYLDNLRAGMLAKSIYSINWISPKFLFSWPHGLSAIYSWVVGWWYVGALGIIVSWLWLDRSQIRKSPLVMGLLTTTVVAGIYLKTQIDLGHVLKGGLALFILLAPAIRKKVYYLGWIGSLIAIQLALSLWIVNLNNFWVNLPIGGWIRLPGQLIANTTIPSAKSISQSIDFLRQADPAEPVFVAPYLSSLYFLSGRTNPTIYDNLLSGYLLPGKGEDYVISKLTAVKYVVYDRGSGPNGILMHNYYPKIDRYLMTNFAIVNRVDSLLFMQRRASP